MLCTPETETTPFLCTEGAVQVGPGRRVKGLQSRVGRGYRDSDPLLPLWFS